jgi:hypothetical protein
MYRNQGKRLCSDPGFDVARIQVHGDRINVGWYRDATGVDDGIDGAAEGQRRRDHLIAWLNACGKKAQLECGGARPDSGDMTHSLERCEIFLELGHPRASADPTRAKAGDDLFDFLIEYLRLSENNKAVLVVLRV